MPAILLNFASTGVLRGLQDTRTPLVVALVGFPANIVLNVTLVYGAHLGIAGSAWGTALAQLGMTMALITVVVRLARRDGASLRAHPTRVLGAAREGFPLLLRTLSLRGVLLMTTWVAAGLGVVPLAAYQVSSTVWSALTFALDALAIAGQALTGRYLGAGDVAGARAATRLMLWWGVGGGSGLRPGPAGPARRAAARLHDRPPRPGRARRGPRRRRRSVSRCPAGSSSWTAC